MQLQLYLTSLHLGEINVKAQTKKNLSSFVLKYLEGYISCVSRYSHY